MTEQLNFQITHQFDDVEISLKDYQKILSFLNWKQIPPFRQPGRTAWYVLEENAFVNSKTDSSFKAAKIKGVGFWNPRPSGKIYSGVLANLYSEQPTIPTTEVLDSMLTFPHIGFNKKGEYMIAYSSPAPVGGILHERALLEYESARILLQNGVPSTLPFMVIQYGDKYQFNGKRMGVVVNLSPERDSIRLSCIQYGKAVHRGIDAEADAYFDKIRTSLGVKGKPELETTRLQTINLLARKIGKLIHDFSAAGLYRYSSEWSNFEYDFKTEEVFLTDLDSTLQLKDIPAALRPLQVLRDLGTAVYRLVVKFGFPSVLDDYTLTNLLRFDPLTELLVGYFPNAPYDEVEAISKRLWQCFTPYWFLLKKHKEAIWTDWSRSRRQSYKMDHDLFYILTITLVFPLFKDSSLFQLYPSTLTIDDMLQKAKNYLGERYEYFLYLLNEGKMPHQQSVEKGYELTQFHKKGEGVIATKPFKKGQIVMVGKFVKISGGNHSHAAQIAKNVWAIHEGLTHKVNHSCEPNIGIHVNETGAHDFIAMKDIAKGDEIVIDYALRNYQVEHFPGECRCGSTQCRVKITGWKDLPVNKKEEYYPWAATYLLELEEEASH